MRAKPGIVERIAGKAKRAVGELTGRPDLVLEGEAEDTGLPREDEADRRRRRGAAERG